MAIVALVKAVVTEFMPNNRKVGQEVFFEFGMIERNLMKLHSV